LAGLVARLKGDFAPSNLRANPGWRQCKRASWRTLLVLSAEGNSMSTSVAVIRGGKRTWLGVIGSGIVLVLLAMGLANLRRAPMTADLALDKVQQNVATEPAVAPHSATKDGSPTAYTYSAALEARLAPTPQKGPYAATGRKIIRTGSVEMVVAHPAETAERIAALAESLGGYLERSDGGGESAALATLTVRIPAARFEQARTEIHNLGVRIQSEKIEAQDVTRQYVDQDANLRNLRAEESQYLTILKQAGTVRDLLAVSEKLSEVRGQIEQGEAEFHALSQQIETVAITISLRTETEAQVFGLDWRPAYRLKMALRDGLESLATYATSMMAILFYIPAAILWLGTIVLAALGGHRILRWMARRWFGRDMREASQG